MIGQINAQTLATMPIDTKRQLAEALIENQRRQAGLPPGAVDLLTWTMANRPWLKEDHKFDLTRHAYIKAIYLSQAKRKVIYKASQMGASEWAISYALHMCDQRAGNVLYIFPTDGTVNDFSSARLNPAIDASPYLAGIVSADKKGSGGGKYHTDRVTLKKVRSRHLYLRGAQVKPDGSAKQLKSIDGDAVIFDELDEIDPRAVSIAEKRLNHSQIAEMVLISTPTYYEMGIHAEFLKSDAREWFIPCPHCGRWQTMTQASVITELDALGRPSAWHGMAEGRAYAACEKCGRELDRLAQGEWVAAHPGRPTEGYHLTRLFSPYADLLAMVAALQSTDPTERKEALNQDWGEPYRPEGGQMTDQVLDACRRDYAMGAQPDERPFMGIDVGSLLHIVIRGPVNSMGERPLRLAVAVATFDEAAALIRAYDPQRIVIDAAPETRKARDLQRDFRGRLYLAYFPDLAKSPDPYIHDPAKGNIQMDRTRTLDAMFNLFTTQENTIPADIRERVPDYYKHLKAPARVIEKRQAGVTVARYVEGSKADHFALAEVYAWAASQPIKGAPAPGIMLARGVKGWGS